MTLTVTDNEGGTGTVTKTVTTVANQPPTGSFSSVVTKQQVAFSSTSSDPDGTVTGYLWDFGDGGTSTLANPAHTFPAVATYPVSLTLTDNDGGTTVITNPVTTVGNTLPTGSFSSVVNKQQASFTSTADDADGTVTGYLWDFGDGSATSTLVNPIHTFPGVATYPVSLTLTDNDGGTTVITNPVTTVANQAPVADFAASVNKQVVDVRQQRAPAMPMARWRPTCGTSVTGARRARRPTRATPSRR